VIRYIQDPRVTFKDLQKLVESQSQPDQTSPLFDRLRDKPFWIFDQHQHKLEDIKTKGQCCFWHMIGPPQKDNHDMPVLPYQRTVYEALQSYKHLWILKSRGIGLSSFMLRYIAWCCVSGVYSPNDRACVVVGPRLDLAEDLIARFKSLFTKTAYTQSFDRTASTVAFVNGVSVEAFPSHHTSSMRGLDSVKCIFSDESDYYNPAEQNELRAVIEGYIGKPNSVNA
jgi:hypothetical protein